ncbi:RNA exonuclease 4 [Porphyridium purpureum]|uniref:RNA exonuclease 4 n=1 Tax=Porphyridium purpureum TaxID=35688 RepID=A0A5J4YRC2_PORPP|nr:RNA exonuclease 4 [Porphyridium purpureum]|eukprot:POR9740..scf296_7
MNKTKGRHAAAAVDANWKQLVQSGGVVKKGKTKRKVRKLVTEQPEVSGTEKIVVARRTGQGAPLTKVLAIDCEFVGVGPRGERDALARVSVVNYKSEVVLDTHVQVSEKVTDYRTAVSGVRREHLDPASGAVTFRDVQLQVSEMLKGRILVGHDVQKDLKVLLLDHPRRMTRDTATYKPLQRAAGITVSGRHKASLRQLCARVLSMRIQDGAHDSVQDASATLALYKNMQKAWESTV